MKPAELAYRIAWALQKKCKGKIIGLRTTQIGEQLDKLLFEYTISEGGKISAATAYSQGFFEYADNTHASWLAKKIYTELTTRYEWATIGSHHGRTNVTQADVSSPDKESGPANSTISIISVPKNRRGTSSKRKRSLSK